MSEERDDQPATEQEPSEKRTITIGEREFQADPVPGDMLMAVELALARAQRGNTDAGHMNALNQVFLAALERILSPEDADAAVDEMLAGRAAPIAVLEELLNLKPNRQQRRHPSVSREAPRRSGGRRRRR